MAAALAEEGGAMSPSSNARDSSVGNEVVDDQFIALGG
jgi:hypothetical protein